MKTTNIIPEKKMQIPEFLKSTDFCDSEHPDIVATANEITRDCVSDKEKAMRIFYYVRDNIPYTFGLWNYKASETLKSKVGMCTSKANLMIAFLRASGIPAGYMILKVNSQDYFGPVTPISFRFIGSKKSVHVYPVIWLDGRWIRADASTDRGLAEKTAYIVYSTIIVEWDGYHDAIDPILPKHIYSDNGPFSDIDAQMNKKPRMIINLGFRFFNYYLKFMRTTRIRFSDERQIEDEFIKWAYKNRPIYAIVLSVTKIYGKIYNIYSPVK